MSAVPGEERARNRFAFVLRPARSLMNRLSYPQKFLLISVLFALPLGVVMYLLVTELNDRVEFSTREMEGNQYLRPLRKMQEDVWQSRLLAAAYAQGDVTVRPDLVRMQAEIDGDVSQVERVDQVLGARLDATRKFRVLKENHRFLKERVLDLRAGEADQLHAKLLEDVRGLFSHVGDTSNLILDPDLDSYYLMDAALLKLPALADYIAQARILGRAVLTRQSVRPEERAEAIRLASLIESTLEETRSGMAVAYRTNTSGRLKTALSETFQAYDAAISDFVAAHRRELTQPQGPRLDAAAYDALANKARAANLLLWERDAAELDG